MLIFASCCTVVPAQSSTPTPKSGDEHGINVTSPLDYQVFQRTTLIRGRILLEGKIFVPADEIRVLVSGTSFLSTRLPDTWKRLHFDRKSGSFRAYVPLTAGGFYEVKLQALEQGSPVANAVIPHVGVGEVFVVSGQSNSTNYGEVSQVSETGMVVAFDGTSWRIANDPQPGVQDDSHQGSFIPSFGDALYRKYHVPIGVAAVGHGSTSVRQWLPAGKLIYVMPTMTRFVTRNSQNELVSDGTLFDGMMKRIHQLGKHGFRALLWHQGESDAHQAPEHSISAEQYRAMMVELIRASRKNAGWKFPWIVAEATYNTPARISDPALEQAQRSLWQNGIALQGPDTDDLGPEYRQDHGRGVHFNNEGLKKHGEMWAQAVEVYLDKALAP